MVLKTKERRELDRGNWVWGQNEEATQFRQDQTMRLYRSLIRCRSRSNNSSTLEYRCLLSTPESFTNTLHIYINNC